MNKAKQIFYKFITTPIAKFIDFCNISKRKTIIERRKVIAKKNMIDYIDMTSHMLFEQEIQEKLNEGLMPNPLIVPLIIANNIEKAHIMFQEKKRKGDFDDLNIMLK